MNKNKQLENIQQTFVTHQSKLNAFKSQYKDWFYRKHTSFVVAVTSVQVYTEHFMPSEITTVRKFRKIFGIAQRLQDEGCVTRRRNQNQIVSDLKPFIEFWIRFCELRTAYISLWKDVAEFCGSIERLKEPGIEDRLAKLNSQFNLAFSEDYDFTGLNNERHNLFTYQVGGYKECLGLLGFIPYLLDLLLNLCYWVSKLRIEKP